MIRIHHRHIEGLNDDADDALDSDEDGDDLDFSYG